MSGPDIPCNKICEYPVNDETSNDEPQRILSKQ